MEMRMRQAAVGRLPGRMKPVLITRIPTRYSIQTRLRAILRDLQVTLEKRSSDSLYEPIQSTVSDSQHVVGPAQT